MFFSKHQLRNGDVVLLNNGLLYYYNDRDQRFINSGGWMDFNQYNNKLQLDYSFLMSLIE